MERIDDDMLLDELRKRLEENKIALSNLRSMTQTLESMNEKLRQSEALKSDFLSNIRNEIINPLTAILGISRQVAARKADAAEAAEMAQTIYDAAFELDFQLRNIFAAAELEAGDVDRSIAKVDVAALVHGQIEAFRHKAAEKKVTIEFSCETEPGLSFKTDPDKLQKIVANLLANAIEFNLEGKRVLVRLWIENKRLNISFSDEGLGIPEADRKKVFDRFVQLDSGVSKRHKGHGLGLSITKALTEMLEGSVSLTSGQGAGCVFTVSVPESESDQDVTSGNGNEFIFEGGTQF
ncbi:MAG: HAMP domain-containing histidine kinase [Nitrospirota bacterium]|nr:HAMP domain-containing histidine kinase [Nitrospirota bacterium]